MATKAPVLPDVAIPPGELLAEELGARGLTQKGLAEMIGRTRRYVSDIIHARSPITPETALRLEAALGIEARIWLGLEAEYRLILAQQDAGTARRLDAIRRRAGAS